jgi:uncharacterized membrane protein
MFWMMDLVPLLGLAALAVVVWLGVRAARQSPLPPVAEAEAASDSNLKTLSHVAYGLAAAALVFPVTAIAALILDYVKQSDAGESWLASHIRWRIRTFWFGLLWSALGLLTFFVLGLGLLILIATDIWWIYRIVRGWVSLFDRRPMPVGK